MRLFFAFFVILFFFAGAGESIQQILSIHSRRISLSLALLSGEFALLVFFLYGIFYPVQVMRHRIPVQIYKGFSAASSLLLIFILPDSSTTAKIATSLAEFLMSNTLIFLIILIFIDFAVCFVLLLYKEEFVRNKQNEGQNYPEFNEIEIEEK
jgi:hypothetical protein